MKPIKITVNKVQHTMHCLMEEKHWLQMLIPDWIIFYKTWCARSVLWPIHKLGTKTISLCLRGMIRWVSYKFLDFLHLYKRAAFHNKSQNLLFLVSKLIILTIGILTGSSLKPAMLSLLSVYWVTVCYTVPYFEN